MNPSLFSRRANRVLVRLSRADVTKSDARILRRRWFPVNIDPVRPGGVSFTEAEPAAAFAMADAVAAWLDRPGFSGPVRANPGNGAHLLYRIEPPNDAASLALVKQGLIVLHAIFPDRSAVVDRTNSNTGRIGKLYGTVARKGDSTPEHLHRRSRIISIPARNCERGTAGKTRDCTASGEQFSGGISSGNERV